MKFKELLTNYRNRSGLNKTDFAKKIGKSPAYVMNLESGRRKPPTYELCKKIVQVLNISKHEMKEFLKMAFEERSEGSNEEFLQILRTEDGLSNKLSPDILEALQDPIAVKALLVTHKNSDDIKNTIKHMLDCLPSLSPIRQSLQPCIPACERLR